MIKSYDNEDEARADLRGEALDRVLTVLDNGQVAVVMDGQATPMPMWLDLPLEKGGRVTVRSTDIGSVWAEPRGTTVTLMSGATLRTPLTYAMVLDVLSTTGMQVSRLEAPDMKPANGW